jgi:hypothetical protein
VRVIRLVIFRVISLDIDVKFMLLHDHKSDENSIKSFFYDIYELYVKVCVCSRMIADVRHFFKRGREGGRGEG